jgi:putative ABC transport system permease protein
VAAGLAKRIAPGVTGSLAAGNATRQPRRTASTASALMVGVALVAFVSIVPASVQASIGEAASNTLTADATITARGGEGLASTAAVPMFGDLDELEVVSPVRQACARIDGQTVYVVGVDAATISDVYAPRTEVDLSGLTGVVVAASVAESKGWTVGDVVDIEYGGGRVSRTEVMGTFEDTAFGSYLVPAGQVDVGVAAVLVKAADGVGTVEALAAIETALSGFPTLDVVTTADLVAQARAELGRLVALFTGLFGLAVVIAVLGIANTLALSVVERTRELGLLRAAGLNRRQVRRMVRTMAVTTALFGATLGIGLGTMLVGGRRSHRLRMTSRFPGSRSAPQERDLQSGVDRRRSPVHRAP